MAKIVMTCPECYRTFPEEIRYCGICGVMLVERANTEPLDVAPADESSYIGSLIDGRYQIRRLIGRGGMGSVYEVLHVHMQKVLAMKLLHEDMVVRKQLVSRFTREARAVSRLSNEHTVRVYDFGRHRAVFFLVMELLEGEDLEMLLARDGALPWSRALHILDQVCESLEEAHAAGIIHRDLKPENIMIVRRPEAPDYVKVLDFGLAKIANSDDVFSVHSNRDLFGTPYYMSPEQIRAEAIDHRADVYALGCLFFRMLTNRHAYEAPYAFDVLRQHLSSPIPSVCRMRPEGEIPARVDRLVFRALAKRPQYRFANVAAMRHEIAGCLSDPEGESLPMPAGALVVEPDDAIGPELEARLQAFEKSHEAADARLNGPPSPKVTSPTRRRAPDKTPLPIGIIIDDEPSEPEIPVGTVSEPLVRSVASAPPPDAELARRAATPPPVRRVARYDDDDDDDTGFLLRLRRRRRLRIAALTAVLGSIAVFFIGLALWVGKEPVKTTWAEVEPNDQPRQATRLPPGVGYEGYVGKRLSVVESDRDYYRLSLGGSGKTLDLDLTAIANLDLYVDVQDPLGRPIAHIDYDGLGQVESLHRLRVPSDEVLLVVGEAKPGDMPPTENISDPYTITATVTDEPREPGEVEPNDSWQEANPYKAGETVTGWLDGVRDVDFYRVNLDGVMDLRRWEVSIECDAAIVPRVSLYRIVGDDKALIYSDEGHDGVLKTVYEEPSFPNPAYLVAVEHSGRGAHRGTYRLTADVIPGKPRIAHEPDDDWARANALAVGQGAQGMLDSVADTDLFSVPVTDPRHRTIEVQMDGLLRERVRVTITDASKVTQAEYPPRVSDKNRVPQPELRQGFIRFTGEGETYYIALTPLKRRDRDVTYDFRVFRLMTDQPAHRPAVGGPGY